MLFNVGDNLLIQAMRYDELTFRKRNLLPRLVLRVSEIGLIMFNAQMTVVVYVLN